MQPFVPETIAPAPVNHGSSEPLSYNCAWKDSAVEGLAGVEVLVGSTWCGDRAKVKNAISAPIEGAPDAYFAGSDIRGTETKKNRCFRIYIDLHKTSEGSSTSPVLQSALAKVATYVIAQLP
jgi:hypothetical protein